MQGLLLHKLPYKVYYKITQKLISQCNFIKICGKIAKNCRNWSYLGCQMEFVKM